MPLRRFWLMQGNIGRISATEDMRELRHGVALGGGKENLQEYQSSLELELGTVSTSEEKLDREGLQRLAAMM
ncbi:MAG: hypothetical protein HRT93_03070 [Piscirickettsiaceae bacterium]|nr:hypothetical protein [Piscirickettsiaceae bacterium]